MAEINKKELFEEYPVKKAIRVMAVPTIISQLINLIYSIVDTFFIGRTGNSFMMAGISVSFTLFVMLTALANFAGVGGGSQVARLMGRGENQRSRQVCSFSIILALSLALAYIAIVGLLLKPILNLFGASENSYQYAKQYVLITVIIGGIPTILSMTFAHLLRNSGNAKQASMGLSGGGILNMILDPILMFVVLPKGYEVIGAALATCLSNIASCTYLFFVLKKTSKSGNLETKFSEGFKILKEDRKTVFSVGIPAFLLTAFFDMANMFLNSLVSTYGDISLAAIGLTMKIERLPNAFCLGIAQGVLPIIAYNYSCGNKERMNEVIRTARRIGLLIAFSCILVLEISAKPLVQLFMSTKGSNPENALSTIAFAIVFLRIRCLAAPVQFLNYQSSFTFQAIGDGKITLLHCVVRECVFYIPFMFILNALFGLYGLVSSVVLGEACGAAFALILLSRRLSSCSK